MNDNYEINPVPAEPKAVKPSVKWLRILFYIHITSIVLSLLSALPINAGFTTWISRVITLAVSVSLFNLAPASERYRKAAVFTAVSLGLTLASMLLMPSLLTLAASILSILATYQEYSAHSDMVAHADPKLSRNWHSLFNWQLVVGLLTSFVSMVAVVVLVAMEVNASNVTALVVGILTLVSTVLGILYLAYLNRMIRIFGE